MLATAFLFLQLLSNRIMTNLLVSTTNADEKARMEEEFSLRDGFFHLPTQDSSTLEALFRAVSFQYFHNSPTLLAQKIMTFAENALNRIFCMDLMREIMQMASTMNNKITLYKQYFSDINRQLGEDMVHGEITLAEGPCRSGQDMDKVFALAEMGQMRLTRHLQTANFQESDLKPKIISPIQFSERTQVPSTRGQNPQQQAPVGQEANNLSQIFYSAESYYGSNQWWRQENHPNDSSREISKFDCKAGTPLHQKSIGGLVIEELRYDLKREIEIGKDINKHQQEAEGSKYKKMMKEKLLTAKLKKRKKK